MNKIWRTKNADSWHNVKENGFNFNFKMQWVKEREEKGWGVIEVLHRNVGEQATHISSLFVFFVLVFSFFFSFFFSYLSYFSPF